MTWSATGTRRTIFCRARICGPLSVGVTAGDSSAVVRFTISNSSSSLRIIDEDVEHEAVQLGLGQRIGALVLDGVLRGQHEERLGQPMPLPPAVIWCSCIASSRAACVFGGVRLISSARITLAKIGPLRNLNSRAPVSLSSWITSVPVMSEGIRSGVNWMRLNCNDKASARVRIISVLASPGTPTSRQCPRANMAISSSSMTCCWPTITRPNCSVMRPVGLVQLLDGLDVVFLQHGLKLRALTVY